MMINKSDRADDKDSFTPSMQNSQANEINWPSTVNVYVSPSPMC